MSSLIQSLKSEIARIARRELKPELAALRKAATAHRSEIAELKRKIKTLASELRTTKRSAKAGNAVAAPAAPKSRFKFSGPRFAAWRKKVGITRASTASLVMASDLSVFKWETEKAQPRSANLQQIAAVMKLGKREVMKRLQQLQESEARSTTRKPTPKKKVRIALKA